MPIKYAKIKKKKRRVGFVRKTQCYLLSVYDMRTSEESRPLRRRRWIFEKKKKDGTFFDKKIFRKHAQIFSCNKMNACTKKRARDGRVLFLKLFTEADSRVR